MISILKVIFEITNQTYQVHNREQEYLDFY